MKERGAEKVVSDKEPSFKELYEQLTEFQRACVDNYLADPSSKTNALRKAGSKAKNLSAAAHELFSQPKVKATLEAARREALKRAEITVDRILLGLYEEATREGEGSSHSARVQAWTQLGKHLGMFPTTIKGKIQHTLSFEEALKEVFGDDDNSNDDSLFDEKVFADDGSDEPKS